jgi:hypothetical protein
VAEDDGSEKNENDQQYTELARIDTFRYGKGEICNESSVRTDLEQVHSKLSIQTVSIDIRKTPDTKQRRMSARARRDLTHGKQNRNLLGGAFCRLWCARRWRLSVSKSPGKRNSAGLIPSNTGRLKRRFDSPPIRAVDGRAGNGNCCA